MAGLVFASGFNTHVKSWRDPIKVKKSRNEATGMKIGSYGPSTTLNLMASFVFASDFKNQVKSWRDSIKLKKYKNGAMAVKIGSKGQGLFIFLFFRLK
jgi:hypothetical protein